MSGQNHTRLKVCHCTIQFIFNSGVAAGRSHYMCLQNFSYVWGRIWVAAEFRLEFGLRRLPEACFSILYLKAGLTNGESTFPMQTRFFLLCYGTLLVHAMPSPADRGAKAQEKVLVATPNGVVNVPGTVELSL